MFFYVLYGLIKNYCFVLVINYIYLMEDWELIVVSFGDIFFYKNFGGRVVGY